jgi:putative flippase GtrA
MIKSLLQQLLNLFYPLVKKWLPFDVYAYLAVGAINTGLNILLFAAFYHFLPLQIQFGNSGMMIASYTVGLLLSFLATVPTGFWLAKNLAFQQSANTESGKQLIKYFLVVLQGLLTDYLLMLAMIELLQVHPTVAKVVSTLIVLSFNYLLQKFFTFKAVKVGVK